jgi:hypothetical protein
MYLLKHIFIGVNSVNNQLIVALVLTTSAYLFSLSAYSGTSSQTPVQLRAPITAGNGHLNADLFYSNINKYPTIRQTAYVLQYREVSLYKPVNIKKHL